MLLHITLTPLSISAQITNIAQHLLQGECTKGTWVHYVLDNALKYKGPKTRTEDIRSLGLSGLWVIQALLSMKLWQKHRYRLGINHAQMRQHVPRGKPAYLRLRLDNKCTNSTARPGDCIGLKCKGVDTPNIPFCILIKSLKLIRSFRCKHLS